MLDWLTLWWPLIDREWDSIAKHEGTQSQALAETFRTESRAGKWAFGAAAFAGCAWLVAHICRFEYSAKRSRP